MADYGTLLGTPEAAAFGARVRDYSTLLAGRPLPALHGRALRVAYQDSCHLRNGQRVTLEPRALLASLPGVEVVDLPSAGRCCGAAGTYALMRPDDSLRFLDAKLGEIAEAGVDAIVSGNPGCLLQFRQGVQRAGLEGVRVLHTAEVVAERMPR
jgi:glycolate oxidase iron-sulfur subunit